MSAKLKMAAKRKKISICRNPEHYAKAYHAFEDLSSKYDEFSSWLQDFFPTAVVDKLDTGSLSTKLKVLGIGSGAGEAESEMLLHLLKKFSRIENTVIEPSKERLLEYKALTMEQSHLQLVDFVWKRQTFEEYQQTEASRRVQNQPKRFHFISALHSLYHVDDPSDVIRFMYDSLESGGILMIALSAVDSGFSRLWSRFPVLATDANYLHLHSDHVKATLDWMKVPHVSVYGDVYMDITSCYQDQSVQSSLALDFITGIVNFREWATPALEEEVLTFLKTSNCSTITPDDKILFNDKWEAVLAMKP